ncbi:hypothetical protein SAMN05443144_10265 [Fodinibius roseus]|uniref:Uncharacterized protein n=1 Tax=Fodinibius roseus TaxID=1194090 RepID=A0A1M4UL01_9BACT|nr:hypothetical protein SAMN05443144_10265 [Fodinibius roseus]
MSDETNSQPYYLLPDVHDSILYALHTSEGLIRFI